MKAMRPKLSPMSILHRANLHPPRPARPDSRPRGTAGFTLLELLIAMAIATILLTLGVGSFSYITNANRLTSEVNGLLGDLQFARAEAIKEGVNVTACVSSDGATCLGATAWQNGWIVFSNPTNALNPASPLAILRLQSPFSSTDTLLASNNVAAITFNREGYAVGIANGSLISLHDATNNTQFTRCLAVSFIGQLITEKYGTITNGVECL